MQKVKDILICFAIGLGIFWIADQINDKHQFISTNKQEEKQAVIVQKDLNADSIASIINSKLKKSNDSMLLILKKQVITLSNQNNQLYEDYLHDMALANMLYMHSGTDSLSKDTRIHRLN